MHLINASMMLATRIDSDVHSLGVMSSGLWDFAAGAWLQISVLDERLEIKNEVGVRILMEEGGPSNVCHT